MQKEHSTSLVIQTAFIGDLLLSVPLLKRLREIKPEDEIHLVCRKGLGQMMLQLGLVNSYSEVQKGDRKSYKKTLEKLKEKNISLTLVPHQSLRTAFFVRSIVCSKKMSFKKWWNFFFFNKRVKKNFLWPDAMRQLSLLAPIDPVTQNRLENLKHQNLNTMNERVPDWCHMGLKSQLTAKSGIAAPYVVLCAGSVWATKKWGDDKFLELAQKFIDEKKKVVFLGAPQDAPENLKESAELIDLCGKTSLYESLLIMSQADLVVTNDSGTMHMASVAQTPTICIFGPTVLSIGYRPWQNQAQVIENNNLTCRPCGKHGHQKCPIGTHECMKSISVEQVQQGARHFLGTHRSI